GGSSHDACWEDRRHTLALDSAGRTGNAKSLRRSSSFLADPTLRQFWSVRAPQSYVGGHTDTLRRSCSGRNWNDPRIGAGFRTNGPYFSPANAPSRQDIANSSRSRGSRIRPHAIVGDELRALRWLLGQGSGLSLPFCPVLEAALAQAAGEFSHALPYKTGTVGHRTSCWRNNRPICTARLEHPECVARFSRRLRPNGRQSASPQRRARQRNPKRS